MDFNDFHGFSGILDPAVLASQKTGILDPAVLARLVGLEDFTNLRTQLWALLERLESSIPAGLEASRLAGWQAGWPEC